MLDALLEAWRTHEGINRYMLDEIPEAGLAAIPLLKNGAPGKGRSVACQIAHCVDVRIAHFRAAEKALMKGVPAFEKGSEPKRQQLQTALDVSGRGVEAVLRRMIQNGDRYRGRSPLILLAYLLSHESHHRGSILLALKQNGFTLSEGLRWAIWGKWVKGS